MPGTKDARGGGDFIMPCTGDSARMLEADRHPDSSLPSSGVIALLLPVLGIRSKGKKDGREKEEGRSGWGR